MNRITRFSAIGSGVMQVQLTGLASIPHSIDFVFTPDKTINVNFWHVQALRRAIPMLEPTWHQALQRDEPERENLIGFIKALRMAFSLGLKEAKDIAEWFRENVDRDVEGIPL